MNSLFSVRNMKVIKIEVCAGTHCTMLGSSDIMDAIAGLNDEGQLLCPDCQLEIVPIPCTGDCDHGRLSPIVRINGEQLNQADSATVMARITTVAGNDGRKG